MISVVYRLVWVRVWLGIVHFVGTRGALNAARESVRVETWNEITCYFSLYFFTIMLVSTRRV